jgi:hypothetical protein
MAVSPFYCSISLAIRCRTLQAMISWLVKRRSDRANAPRKLLSRHAGTLPIGPDRVNPIQVEFDFGLEPVA